MGGFNCILVGFLIAVVGEAVADELVLVQMVWRHGDRSPTTTFPNDTNQVGTWPQGWAQLSALGMQQHYALGVRLRNMYSNFISPTYKAGEIYVRSTDIDRTLMSAMSNLAGFYQAGTPGVTYPSANDVPKWPTNWSPVPIHTVDYDTDLIGYPLAKCARARQLYGEIQQSDSYKNLSAQYKPLFDWLTIVTGSTEAVNLDNIWIIYDALTIEQTNNLPMPWWYNASIYQQITTANNYADDFLFGISCPRVVELIRLRSGSLLKSIVERMNAKVACINNPSSSPDCSALNKLKYYVYSAHDVTIAGLLGTFGDKDSVVGGGLPHYAAAVALELWRDTNGAYQVKILYHPEFNTPFHPITNLTKGCNTTDGEYCALNVFTQRSQMFMPQNITVECQAQSSSSTTPTSTPSTTTKAATSIQKSSTFSSHIVFCAIALLYGVLNRSGHYSI